MKANWTFDFHANYDLPPFSVLPHASVYLDVVNIFDKAPPFFSSTNGFDQYGGNPLGRVVTIGLRSRWGGSASPRPLPVAPLAPPLPPPAATRTCADGSVVLASAACPVPPPPPPPPPAAAPERG